MRIGDLLEIRIVSSNICSWRHSFKSIKISIIVTATPRLSCVLCPRTQQNYFWTQQLQKVDTANFFGHSSLQCNFRIKWDTNVTWVRSNICRKIRGSPNIMIDFFRAFLKLRPPSPALLQGGLIFSITPPPRRGLHPVGGKRKWNSESRVRPLKRAIATYEHYYE